MKFELEVTERFRKKYKKYTSKNSALKEKFNKLFHKLRDNPFQESLQTHKIYGSEFGNVFSSSVTLDLRVLWVQKENTFILLLLDSGGHSGKNSVY